MRKTRISREILLLAIFTTITVFTWISLDVFRAFSKKETPKIIQSQIKPLDPNLDNQVIEDLKKKKLFEFGEVELPEVKPTEEATEAGET